MTRSEPQKIWIEQCQAARAIRDTYGIEKALGYLIAEKLVDFVREASVDQNWAAELPRFVEEIKVIFEPHEIRGYLDDIRRVGPSAHIGTDEEVEFLREAGIFEDDPVQDAENILVVERIKKLLLT